MPADSIKHEVNRSVAHYKLADYLSPNGKYCSSYNDLAEELEEMRIVGYTVYLWSVPGFMMLAGHPDMVSDRPFFNGVAWFKSATDCLKKKNGVE